MTTAWQHEAGARRPVGRRSAGFPLRSLARKTYRFDEIFRFELKNHLPGDNFKLN